MPTWTELGLPCATVERYGYDLDAGLVRTTMDSGYTLQRRKYNTQPTMFKLRWLVDGPGLAPLSDGINAYAYSWIEMPLITGTNGSNVPEDHTVRMTSGMSVAAAGKNAFTVTVDAEQAEAGNEVAVTNPNNVLHTELSDVQLNRTHAAIDADSTALDARVVTIEEDQILQDASIGLLETRADDTDTAQGAQDVIIASNTTRISDNEADILNRPTDAEVMAVFQFAAYIAMRATPGTAFADLGAAWQDLDIITTQSITPVGLVNEGSGRFSFLYPGAFQISISGSFAHNSDTGGRTTQFRLYNETEAVGSTGFVAGTGRNAEATAITIIIALDILASDVGDQFLFQVGNGSAYTTVEFPALNYLITNIGLWQGTI